MTTTAPEQVEPTGKASAHKAAASTAVSITGCAFAAFPFGAMFGAPWPGAVATCGLSVMGVGVAYCMLRQG